MTRTLKLFGLVAVAALAIGVYLVSASQATTETPNLTAGKTTAEEPHEVELMGSGSNEEFHAFGWTAKCELTTYGPNSVTVPVAFFTVKPYHKLCSVTKPEGVKAVTVVTNNCGFQFNIGSTAKDGQGKPIPDTYTGLLDFECENANEAFEVKIWFKSEDHFNNKAPSCIFKLGPQTGSGLTYKVNTNGAHDDLSISGQIKGLHVEQVRNSILCPAGTSTEKGEYTFPTAGATIFARNAGGEELHTVID
jgi:ribosomal protein L31